MIEARSASLCYIDHGREIHAVREASLQVQAGEFLGILGPSGSGKSSLLYLLSGLKSPTSGEVLYRSRNLAQMSEIELSSIRLREFGFVFQFPHLLGYLTAEENVRVAMPDRHDEEYVSELCERLDISDKLRRMPHELSGGERQRVCVARALGTRPAVIFADEPTASLDKANGLRAVRLLNENRGDGALVMVTHDPEMLADADRIVHLEDGRLSQASGHAEALQPLMTES